MLAVEATHADVFYASDLRNADSVRPEKMQPGRIGPEENALSLAGNRRIGGIANRQRTFVGKRSLNHAGFSKVFDMKNAGAQRSRFLGRGQCDVFGAHADISGAVVLTCDGEVVA